MKYLFPLLLSLLSLWMVQPLFGKTDTTRLLTHLEALVQPDEPRVYTKPENLNRAAHYIAEVMKPYARQVERQPYEVNGQTYQNVVASFGPENGPRIIVGAHYDVCDNLPGADDNASGVAGMLELGRQLSQEKLAYRIDLVAYSLEEPPFFRSEAMGSFQHAHELNERGIEIIGMVCLEMLGYFRDEKGSQAYPVGLMKLFYGGKGNYISLVRKFGSGKFARRFNRRFHKTKLIRTKSITAPANLPGIDFSDHLNYWKFGYSALMITDTAFYRNPNYHERTDTIDTLDLRRMALVVDGVFEVLKEWK
ncbi:MAG: M28 family peptidase [Bacteroidota bacterium]